MESNNLVVWNEPSLIISTVERAELYQVEVMNITKDEIKNSMRGVLMEKNNIAPRPASQYKISSDIADRLFIHNPDEWSPKRCVCMATKDRLTLTNEHWIIIAIYRVFYLKNQYSPRVGLVRNDIIKHLVNKKIPVINAREFHSYFNVYNFFPLGFIQSSSLAGMPPILHAGSPYY